MKTARKTRADTASKAGAGANSATPPQAPERAARKRSASAARRVHEIAMRHFGEKARRVGEKGGGLTNAVFGFRVSSGEYIVRTHDDATVINGYLKEQWAMDAARAAGLSVPRVLEVGNFAEGTAYMIQERLAGVDGRQASNRLAVLEALGKLAKKLHGVRTKGFGPVFDWSSNRLSRHTAWADYLADGFDVEKRLATLTTLRMIDAGQARRLREVATQMARWKRPAVLQHGDLRLKNVLVDPADSRIVALIDWDSCTSMPGPYWDLSLALHELGVDEKEAFLGGYGMNAREFGAAIPFIRLFNTLNYARAVESAAKKRDTARLAWFKLRLQGALDLYERAG